MQKTAEVINILEADPSVWRNDLQSLVKLRNGTLECPVHPYWMENSSRKTIPHSPSFAQRRQQFFQACLNSGKVAMLFFHPELELAFLHQQLGVNPDIPLFAAPTEYDDVDLINHEQNFPKLIETLKLIGVKTIKVTGQYMVFHPLNDPLPDYDKDRIALTTIFPKLLEAQPEAKKWAIREVEPCRSDICIPYGCTGITAGRFMIAGFNVIVSASMSWPSKVMTRDEYDKQVNRGPYAPSRPLPMYSYEVKRDPAL